MSVNKAKTPTKDGKYWFFRVVYKDEFNTPKRYNIYCIYYYMLNLK